MVGAAMQMGGMAMDLFGQVSKMGLGFAQMSMANKMNPVRPTYEIPKEVRAQLAMRQANLNGRMAGATQAERNIQQGAANTVGLARRGATSSAQLLGMAAAAQGQANRGYTGLAQAEAQDFQRRQNALAQSQNQMAQYRDKAFQLNKMEPYQDEARTKAALSGAGLQNMFGAMQDSATGLTQMGGFADSMGLGSNTPTNYGVGGAGIGATGSVNYSGLGSGLGMQSTPGFGMSGLPYSNSFRY